jgi:hypothetical protein
MPFGCRRRASPDRLRQSASRGSARAMRSNNSSRGMTASCISSACVSGHLRQRSTTHATHTPRVSQILRIKSRRLPGRRGRPGFLAGLLLWALAAKSGGDDDAAEFDGDVVEGGFGLRGVPAPPGPVTPDPGARPCSVHQTGDHAEADQPERHRPLHGVVSDCGPRPHDLARIGEGMLDPPPRRVTRHQIFRGRAACAAWSRPPRFAARLLADTSVAG